LAPVAHVLRIRAAGLHVAAWQGSHEDYFVMLVAGQLRIKLPKELVLEIFCNHHPNNVMVTVTM
jgi:hypothetical protein